MKNKIFFIFKLQESVEHSLKLVHLSLSIIKTETSKIQSHMHSIIF